MAGLRPRPTLVLLVRHGLTATTGKILPGRMRGLHLNDAGRRQADAAAARIVALGRVAAVYSSPLERARETAAAIARRCHATLRLEPALLECDFGRWTGASLARLARRRDWRLVQARPSVFRFPGGESFVELQARVTAALGRLAARHRGATVVAVSHADPIKTAVAHALGVHLDLFQRLVIAPASITALAYGVDGPRVLTLNSPGADLAEILPR